MPLNSNIAIVYFSATGVTRLYANIIAETLRQLGANAVTIDVTSFDSRKRTQIIENFNHMIFGFPVYADFAPKVINAWLATLDGHGKRCTLFFTYGGRTAGYAHFHTKSLLELQGFQVMFSAEFLGPHAYNLAGWTILTERPKQQDINTARTYASLAWNCFNMADPPVFRLQKPFGYHYAIEAYGKTGTRKERKWPHPYRMIEDCQMCLDCETGCPTHAFDAESGESDLDICIHCMRCVANCPEGVIAVDDDKKISSQQFLDRCYLTNEMLNAKCSKIITEPWHAAA